MSKISGTSPTGPSIIFSVGEEVIQWAEKSWLLDKVCKNELSAEGEKFNYDYFRNCLRTKIDETIKGRLLNGRDNLSNHSITTPQ